MNYRILAALTVLTVLCSAPSFTLELPKLGFVDVERVVKNYTLTDRMRNRMKLESEKIQSEVSRRQLEIQKLTLELSSTNLKPGDRQQKEILLSGKRYELRIFIHESEQHLKALKADLTAQIYSRVARAIEKIGRDKGYVVLFRKTDINKLDDVLYEWYKFDVTQDVQNYLYKELTLPNR